VVANRILPLALGSRRTAGSRPDREEAVRMAKEAGLALDVTAAEGLLEGLAATDRKARTQRGFLNRLSDGAPVLVLPDLVGAAPSDRVPNLARIVAGGEQIPTVPKRRPAGRKPTPPSATTLDGPLEPARIVVVCGSGGTGKTTVSAAIAVHMAQRGRRTVLLTVDPARRLATALRLPMLPGERIKVPLGSRRSMDAIQLDTKRTFDDLVARFATGQDQIDRILSNPVYRRITDTLGGTHEYMAMEKLFQLAEGADYQAIVIDTPPTRSALAFLDAPRRLTDFLGARFLRWMLWPSAQAGKLTVGAARLGASAFLRTVGRLIGTEALADMAEFLGAFQGMYAGFKERATKVLALMRSPDCEFVVVAAPSQGSLEEAGFFLDRLSEGGMRARAVVVNRWHRLPDDLPAGAAVAAGTLLEGSTEQRALALAISGRLQEEGRAAGEAQAVAAFASRHDVPLVAVPEIEADVHDVPGLRAVASELFA
jgi:anion-transporting  ArsA/GET3 family ATPase